MTYEAIGFCLNKGSGSFIFKVLFRLLLPNGGHLLKVLFLHWLANVTLSWLFIKKVTSHSAHIYPS
jgi:hypothetical protein